MMRWLVVSVWVGLVPALSLAQVGPTYRIDHGTLNSGGNPAPVLTSTSYRVTLDALGNAAAGRSLNSGSYSSGAGLPAAFPPPGEVADLRFTASTVLSWAPETSTGTYALYRGSLSSLAGYGNCQQAGLAAATATDPDTPAAGSGFFYLVTARNLLGEEGTSGFDSSAGERPIAAPCP